MSTTRDRSVSSRAARHFSGDYYVTYIGGQMWMAYDPVHATSPIWVAYGREAAERGDFRQTPYQTANSARGGLWHESVAADLVRNYAA